MEGIGDIVVSAFLESLLDRLLSLEFMNFVREGDLNDALQKLKLTLPIVASVVDDAEEKQFEKPNVEAWLKQLKHAVYDAEDVLDEIAFKALEEQVEPTPRLINRKVRDVFSKCRRIISEGICQFREGTGFKIARTVDTLDYLIRQKDLLGINGNPGESCSKVRKRLETTSLINEPCVYGRDCDREEIIDKIIDSDGFCVIPIVGMAGVGKTTLAQLVYNDSRMRDYFDLKAWVCVSNEFNVKELTRTVLECTGLESAVANDLNSLQVNLQEKLSGKKLLLVLDDVWNEDYHQWSTFQKPLRTGAQVCKILVTTRNSGVSSIMGTITPHSVRPLSDEDCWSLFRQHAFENRPCVDPQLEVLGREIVCKCKGLPVAASTIGGLLRSKVHAHEWKDVLISKIWSLSDERGVLPALSLSYLHLPPSLKQCFSYCSIFPKGYEFKEEELVLLWLAGGFIPQLKGMNMGDLARRYFQELLSRSFFQHSFSGNSTFIMHDLIHDLATTLSEGICFRLEDMLECNNQPHSIPENARHLSYVQDYYESFVKFEAFGSTETRLRTFLPLGCGRRFSYLPERVLHELLLNNKYLRVLSLKGSQIGSIPESIGKLKHMRFLDLSHTSVKSLPGSVSTLYNLQTLLLVGCRCLLELPADSGKLINLQHLDTSQSSLMKMPVGIGRLTNLRRLSNFIVGKHGGLRIGELKNLSNLQGSLCISGLENVLDPLEATVASFRKKQHLKALVLEWSEDGHLLSNKGSAEKLLNVLLAHTTLKELTIRRYPGESFPMLQGGLAELEKLIVEDCGQLVSLQTLPSIGNFRREISMFPCLQELTIERCPKLSKLPDQVPSLVKLNMAGCLKLTSLFPEGELPCLKELSILKCPKLINLPNYLPSLLQLHIDSCVQLATLPRFQLIRKLGLNECKEALLRDVADLHSLTSLYLSKIQELRYLPEGLWQQLTGLDNLEIRSCKELETLSSEISLRSLTSLRRLVISDCPHMEHLPWQLQNLTALKKLEIWACPRLRIREDIRLPSMMQGLWISSETKALPQGIAGNMSLERLTVWNSHCLTSFPRCKLPSTLKILEIKLCSKLKSLPEEMMHHNNSLESLWIDSCRSLQSLGLQTFTPTTAPKLKELKVTGCGNLKSFPEGLHYLTSLSSLTIVSCPGLISIPDGGLPVANLRKISISQCYQLKSLPVNYVTSLQALTIRRCPNLLSFPGSSLPPNLERLTIDTCGYLEPICQWGLERLTSLKNLSLIGCSTDQLSIAEGFLPSSLTHLCLKNLPKLKSIGKGLQHLTSLKYLKILRCHRLSALPEEWLPVSLCSLLVAGCPEVREQYEAKKRNGVQQYSRISCLRWDEDVTVIHIP